MPLQVKPPRFHPATLWRTLKPCAVGEGVLIWARAYDSHGAFLAQTPCLRIRNGELVRVQDYQVADESDWLPTLAGDRIEWHDPPGAALCEHHVVCEADPEESTMWFPPTIDWRYDIGAELRVGPNGPINGRQDHSPLVEIE